MDGDDMQRINHVNCSLLVLDCQVKPADHHKFWVAHRVLFTVGSLDDEPTGLAQASPQRSDVHGFSRASTSVMRLNYPLLLFRASSLSERLIFRENYSG